ncbi:MAG TPA: NAD(P)-binding protein, partial [Gemmatales bacterium]|nr:NAD(P)-binding protein [Gemmatales bacterium]
MSIRVTNLRLGIEESEAALPALAARHLGLKADELGACRILRKSLDARDADDLAFVYAIEIRVPPEEEARLLRRMEGRRGPVRVEAWSEPVFALPEPGCEPLAQRPVIVGSGPAGLAAAHFLAAAGYRPLLLERGAPVSRRIRDVAAFDAGGPHDPDSNYLFGEGGAGTFSDGKLTCRGSGPDVHRILQWYADSKGKPSIVYEQRPHLGSNRLPAVVKAQRQRIEALGGELRFHCRVEDLDLSGGVVRGVQTSAGYFPASVVVLAIGHSARDTYEMLVRRGVPLVHKAFQIGLRIEQAQEQVNRHCYGRRRLEDELGAANYTVVAKSQSLDVFSFCMCAGGYVMPSVSTPGEFCTNGMSLSKHDSPFANSGLVVTLEPSQFGGSHPLAGVELQQHFERLAFHLGGGDYRCPIQWASDFVAGRASQGT